MKKKIAKHNIYLIGMPASGKSTLGVDLAEKLHRQFLDLDTLIEQKENKTIPEIFAIKGEEQFRKVEKEILYSVRGCGLVIATGGGAPCFFRNMEYINKNGISIWLNVAPHVLAERVLKKAGSRPLLKDYEGKVLIKALNEKLGRRKTYYQQAHIIYNPSEQNMDGLIHQLASFKKA